MARVFWFGLIVPILLCSTPLIGADISLPLEIQVGETTYSEVRYYSHNPSKVKFHHSNGIAEINTKDMPDSVKAALQYSDDEANKWNQEQKEIGIRKAVATEQKKSNEEMARRANKANIIKDSLIALREIETDPISFLDKPVWIEGAIDVSNYYNWGFREAQEKFLSFRIRSGDSICHVYADREFGGRVRSDILKAGGPLIGVFEIVIPGKTYAPESPNVLALLLGVVPPLEEYLVKPPSVNP